ncbi:protein REVEILLE 8-like isoform X2 [Asparagus officinalis]|uniref:protein REVEILLE 8-like isoform X2 n=1 Tax=Asparagus officinalis TaxID=4686 RepID=UPI00098E214F|nr:protein REVEILLE 8-like isoform X2 [Asparagus officinalis]
MDADGSSKKLRKPYTITKSRERWSEEEHERFLDGLLLFGREWKKIEDFVGTKTVIQIRSHAQKYFLKVQKNGLMAHVPPPLPRRNHAYSQKSSEDAMLPIQASVAFPSPSGCYMPPCASWDEKAMLMGYASSSDSMSSNYPAILSGVEGDNGSGIADIYNQKFFWSGSSSRSNLMHEAPEQGSQQSLNPVVPNFAEVYNLIATMFDPEITDPFPIYMKKLNEMDPITAKTGRWLVTCDANNKATGETSVAAAAVANQIYSMPSQYAGFLPMP